MSKVELLVFPGATVLADAAAERWLSELSHLGHTRYSVALSGGRIAGQFFSSLARSPHANLLCQLEVHFFWGDERCVAATDLDSNFRSAFETLLKPLGIPQARIHRIPAEEAPDQAAALAEAELRKLLQVQPPQQPCLDLVFLGMGEEGHVASLFPGEPESIRKSPLVYRGVTCPKPPPQRITLGYPVLAAARQVWVLASGNGKEEALARSLDDQGATPLAGVIKSREKSTIFTDLNVVKAG